MNRKMIRLSGVIFLALFSSSLWAQAGSRKEDKKQDEVVQSVRVSIKWGKVQRAAAYEYLITDLENNVIMQNRVTLNKVVISLPPGKYYLQVAAVSSGGNLGEWSQKQSMVVYPPGSEEERSARLQVIDTLSSELSRAGAEGELGNLGLGKVNMFGAGFDINGAPVGTLYPFNDYIGGHIYFRYYKLFFNNLKPEFRLGFLSSYNPAISSNATLAMIKLYGYLNYSLGLFNNSFFIVPQVGAGLHYINLAAETFGRWYLHFGASAGLELAYQPLDAFRIFIRVEYIWFWVGDNFTNQVDMILPSAGVALRF